MHIQKVVRTVVIIICMISCSQSSKKNENNPIMLKDPLPSFNTSVSKQNIINFVTKVTNNNHKDFVQKKDRVVVFDNDGTLWVEQPLPSQIFFAFDRIKTLSKTNSELKNKMPYKAIVEDDFERIKSFTKTDVVTIVGVAHAMDNIEDFDSVVNQWLNTAKHPVLKKQFTKLVYQPMLELLDYLKDNDFKIYIVSGGSQEFMRVWAPEVYGIPKEHIIGSTFKREVNTRNGAITVSQTKILDFNDDHEGKILAIDKYIGKKPIMVVGNSDGDLEMMHYCNSNNPLPNFLLFLNHTDGEREFLYDENTLAGKLEKGMQVAQEKQWTIINMKTDWKTVFPN